MLETAVDEEGYGDVKDQETIGNDKDLKLKYLGKKGTGNLVSLLLLNEAENGNPFSTRFSPNTVK